MKYTSVALENIDNYERAVLRGRETGREFIYEIPVHAVADRMELYGLESLEQALEFIGRQVQYPEQGQEAVALVNTAYKDVVQSEFAQSIMPNPIADVSVLGQTIMAPLRITEDKRTMLSERRTQALQAMGMVAQTHSGGGMRMTDSTRPVERTVPAAAAVLEADESVIIAIVEALQSRATQIEMWRVETAASHVPQLRSYLLRRSKRQETMSV